MSENIMETTKDAIAIIWIPIDKISDHPDNPRKDLGDLTELAESIKAKGILQNLTVVKRYGELTHQWIGTYVCVIGHRRKAAAKLAGLTEVPCVVSDLSPSEQIQTMLLENIQRSDLTPYEQAKGFQMMMDFGGTVEEIAEKTGFSQTTVRRRLKMAELDEKNLKEASKRQISIRDYDRLSQIEDIKVRNKVLSYIGTNNFEGSLAKALQEQQNKALEKAWRETLTKLGGIEISKDDLWNRKYKRIGSVVMRDGNISDAKKAIEGMTSFYFALSYGSCHFRIDNPDKETDTQYLADIAREREAEQRRARTAALTEAFGRAYSLRHEFAVNITDTEAKKQLRELIECAIEYEVEFGSQFDDYNFSALLRKTDENEEELEFLDIKELVEEKPHYSMFAFVYAMIGDSRDQNCFNWNGEYQSNKRLEYTYQFLGKFGYEMSDEEKKLLNGESELYR